MKRQKYGAIRRGGEGGRGAGDDRRRWEETGRKENKGVKTTTENKGKGQRDILRFPSLPPSPMAVPFTPSPPAPPRTGTHGLFSAPALAPHPREKYV